MLRLFTLLSCLMVTASATAQRTTTFGWSGSIDVTYLDIDERQNTNRVKSDYNLAFSGGLTAHIPVTDHLDIRTGLAAGCTLATQEVDERFVGNTLRTIIIDAHRLFLEVPVFVQVSPFRENGLYVKSGLRLQQTLSSGLSGELDIVNIDGERPPFTPREADFPSQVVFGEAGIGLAKFDGDRVRNTWVEINFGSSLGNWIERAPAQNGRFNSNYVETARLLYLRLSFGTSF